MLHDTTKLKVCTMIKCCIFNIFYQFIFVIQGKNPSKWKIPFEGYFLCCDKDFIAADKAALLFANKSTIFTYTLSLSLFLLFGDDRQWFNKHIWIWTWNINRNLPRWFLSNRWLYVLAPRQRHDDNDKSQLKMIFMRIKTLWKM